MTGLLDELRERTGLGPAAPARPEPEPHEDAPQGDDDRYAIYALRAGGHRRMAETSIEGVGLCLLTLREENEFDQHDRIGILDRLARTWLVNPWARG